ncbi:hypothetical protein [Desulfospira joergensenii]|uniref:hypothetical protein n=1 Tax=Desulfospira joergensenii TaxID=53329 RepID=UPI0003B6503C|nr:hypothetical protein [Desulfospira joergensenii]
MNTLFSIKYGWWIFQAVLILVSVFFLIFGIDLLMASYRLDDPFSFIMTFFAANFILLISVALGISFVIKMVRVYKKVQKKT